MGGESVSTKLDNILKVIEQGSSKFSIRIIFATSFKLRNVNGYLWAGGSASSQIDIINGVPSATGVSYSGSASKNQDTGHTTGTIDYYTSISSIWLLDENKVAVKRLYPA